MPISVDFTPSGKARRPHSALLCSVNARPWADDLHYAYCRTKYAYFKLKCQKEYVSVLALRGPEVLRADRQQQRSQIKKAADNQEENSE